MRSLWRKDKRSLRENDYYDKVISAKRWNNIASLCSWCLRNWQHLFVWVDRYRTYDTKTKKVSLLLLCCEQQKKCYLYRISQFDLCKLRNWIVWVSDGWKMILSSAAADSAETTFDFYLYFSLEWRKFSCSFRVTFAYFWWMKSFKGKLQFFQSFTPACVCFTRSLTNPRLCLIVLFKHQNHSLRVGKYLQVYFCNYRQFDI